MAKKKKRNGNSETAPKSVRQNKIGPASSAGPVEDSGTREPETGTLPHDDSPPDFHAGFPVVGIGASAGGLEALEELLDQLPADSGMAYVVVTHQHPGHASLLPDLLARSTRLKVTEAEHGTRLEPDHVYVCPPGGLLAITGGALQRVDAEKSDIPRLPIDYFFRSLAASEHDQAIGIVLSGTGTDGTLGLKAIKGEAGLVVVQEPGTAKFPGMPASAISAGIADYVAAPGAMPRHLAAYSRGFTGTRRAKDSGESELQKALNKILGLVRARTGNDFSAYKMNTLRRRIERRMSIHQITDPNEYFRYLERSSDAVETLFKELLIGVTGFFRDPDAWESLCKQSLTELLRSRPEDYDLRAWVPGCSTGEEPLSLAIAIRECMEAIKRHIDVHVFATDIDADAIEAARAGMYPDGIAVDVAPARLERFFVRQDGCYRIRKEIRDMTIFAVQNVLKDPPFTKLDIISCRNLLIYLNAEAQRRLLAIFHYALKPGGILFLGTSETIGNLTDFFEIVDKRWKIFRRKDRSTANLTLPDFPVAPSRDGDAKEQVQDEVERRTDHPRQDLIERALMQRFAPASVVTDERGNIHYVNGRTGMFLEPVQGRPRHNAIEMAREGLQAELVNALRHAPFQDRPVTREKLTVKTNGDYKPVRLTVEKLGGAETLHGLFLVTFQIVEEPAARGSAARKRSRRRSPETRRIEDLERELQYTRESLQTTVEELETANEELKSTNEELQSTNEELQSTNEELETSKEELQSLNEELTTVNAELGSKLEDLSLANDDMQNLMNSIDITTVFLDNDLAIKRFTDRTTSLVALRAADIGRPISDLALNIEGEDLVAICRTVLRTLASREIEIRTREGSYYLVRIMPYRTAENVIDGVVLTFIDVDQLKKAEEAAEKRTAEYRDILDGLEESIAVLDAELHIRFANRAFVGRIAGSSGLAGAGELFYKIGGGAFNQVELRQLLEKVLSDKSPIDDLQVVAAMDGRSRSFSLSAGALGTGGDPPARMLVRLREIGGGPTDNREQ